MSGITYARENLLTHYASSSSSSSFLCPRLFIRENSGSLYDGVEKVLGAFKRRYERERGADKISVTCKFTPNIFADGYSPANLETIVDKIRLNLFGEEALQPEEGAPPSLDLLQLLWMDHAHNVREGLRKNSGGGGDGRRARRRGAPCTAAC